MERGKALTAAAILALGACTVQPNPRLEEDGGDQDAPDVETEIAEMLHASAGSWNAGDLEAFLDDYSSGAELTFVGSSGVQRGLEEVRARYQSTYWAPNATRDSLRFEELEVRTVGDDHALTLGKYVLYRPAADSVTSTGRFTLVLERREEGWKIIHDHSSESGGE